MSSPQKSTKTQRKPNKQESHGLGYKVRLLSQLIGRMLQAKLTPYGLTPYHWFVLRELWAEDGLAVSQITDRLQEVGGTMTGVLDRMEERDLITRIRDKADRRIWRVYLTAKGKTFESVLPPVINRERKKLTKGTSANELEIFHNVLDQLIENALVLSSEEHPG